MALPFDYALANLGRRPVRTALTALASALVAALLVATVAFVRGVVHAFGGAAQPDVALLLSSVAERDVLRSTTPAGLAALVEASVPGVLVASDEIHQGTHVLVEGDDEPRPGFVRGITDRAYRVHDALVLVEGRVPGPGEVMVGTRVARQLGVRAEALALGRTLHVEGAPHVIVGRFAARGTTLESEIWTPLEPLRGLSQRDDSSAVFVRIDPAVGAAHLALFADRRLDLELEVVPSADYYRELVEYLAPIRRMALALALLIGVAALCAGANTASAAVQDRIRELAALRAVGFGGFALARSLAQEALVIAAIGGLAGLVAARFALDGAGVRIAMSAAPLEIDAVAIAAGGAGTLVLAAFGVAPAMWRCMRLPIAQALTED
jgi:putative ABC transport system permease protein